MKNLWWLRECLQFYIWMPELTGGAHAENQAISPFVMARTKVLILHLKKWKLKWLRRLPCVIVNIHKMVRFVTVHIVP